MFPAPLYLMNMNSVTHPKFITLIGAYALFGPLLVPQDATAGKETPPKVDEAAMMAQMMELAKPGENHKILEKFVGSWTYTVKYWPGGTNVPPMESSGTASTKAEMGGRYFISQNHGKMQMPGPDGSMNSVDFEGMAVEGYDNVK